MQIVDGNDLIEVVPGSHVSFCSPELGIDTFYEWDEYGGPTPTEARLWHRLMSGFTRLL